MWIYAVLVGGGTPCFPQHERQVALQLIEGTTFGSEVIHLRCRVKR